jgi:type IV secretory pathway VirB2 component (pilin)
VIARRAPNLHKAKHVKSVLKFFRQPLNQAALAGVIGTGLAVLQGSMSWQHALPVAAGAIVALILPDNSVAVQDIEALVGDAVKAAGDLQKTAVPK